MSLQNFIVSRVVRMMKKNIRQYDTILFFFRAIKMLTPSLLKKVVRRL